MGEATPLDDGNLASESLRILRVMGNDEGGYGEPREVVGEKLAHLLSRMDVERCEWLIE